MAVKQELGFVGVGRMGIHMAGRLLEAGYGVTIFDLNETNVARLVQRGAKRAASPVELGAAADIVFASLPTPDIVKSVALDVAAGGKTRTLVDLSTTGPVMAREVAGELAAKGVTMVDAPVSGGPGGAERGTVAIMVACKQELAETLRPILEVMGKVFWIGAEPGQGQAIKLVNNILSASAVTMASEALALGAKAGIDADTMIAVINSGSGRNTATEDKFPRCVLTRRFDFGFSVGLMHKDVKLAVSYAEQLGVPMVVGNAVNQLLSITEANEGFNGDLTTTARTVEKWAGVEIKGNVS
jgi:3-hydroxyisobutyrate dehydrogenase-like beta-hydroxyacid dehydrogenase